MSQLCDKHIVEPVRIYDQCVACEIESLRAENAKLLASEAIAFNENNQLRYLIRRQREQLEKYMKRVKILTDALDKIIDGEGNPIEIAIDACGEAITVRR